MSNRVKLPNDKNVVVRADGRRLVRMFVYLSEANAKGVARHCFESGETMSEYIDKNIGHSLAKEGSKKKPSKSKKDSDGAEDSA